MPDTTSQAQYSLPFALATMLCDGTIAPAHITGKALGDPEIAAILPRILVREEARHSIRFPQGRWSDLTVTLTDGTIHRSSDVAARGGPEAPMALDEVKAKFHLMARDLPDTRRARIWDMRDQLLRPGVPFAKLSQLVFPAVPRAGD